MFEQNSLLFAADAGVFNINIETQLYALKREVQSGRNVYIIKLNDYLNVLKELWIFQDQRKLIILQLSMVKTLVFNMY